MDKKQEAFLQELLADFKVEASEHHQSIINGLLELEKVPPTPVSQQLIETTFREIHSLKGAARAVNLIEIERLCQSMENVFHAVKQGSLELAPLVFDAIYKAVDTLNVLLTEIDKPEKSVSANTLSQLMKRLDSVQRSNTGLPKMTFAAPPPPSAEPAGGRQELVVSPPTIEEEIFVIENKKDVSPAVSLETPVSADVQRVKDTVRISTAKLGKLLLEAEEFISLKSTLSHYIKELNKRNHRDQITLVRDLKRFNRSMSRMIDDLLLDIKTTLLYPFSTLLEIVPKIVRDLGKEFDKEITVVIQGGEIEIDRRILEELKDPIIHLIRNCIDHGIETKSVREQRGKNPVGLLGITIRQESGNQIELTIRDDGAGIDRDKLIHAAIKMGVVTGESINKMSDHETNGLIFKSGISTSPFITDISGRGLGMAIVADKVSKLGGNIAIDSVQGKGAAFTITLPVTLATFRGILVRAFSQMFVIPTSAVDRALRVPIKEIRTVESKQYITLNGETIAMVHLGDVLGIAARKIKQDETISLPMIILSLAQKRIAFIVDEVFGEQEGTVKTLGPQLVHVRNISGAIVLGNGSVIPIVNIQEIMESASRTSGAQLLSDSVLGDDNADRRQKSILVAEDSITLRSLLRNIIESVGYKVKTAVDGMEAFQFLSEESFDLVVSDVEMPRMSGFDLTARIRGDKRFTELPVILVTALDSHEDRQRGMESGANAYIVKGSFEQSNLIETIKRLI
ncbi:MAG: response regulator [Bacteroidetes bacterium]|nr:response regulator [Bacteroidota bacterium]